MVVGLDEALDPAPLQPLGERVPVGERLGGRLGAHVDRPDDDDRRRAPGVVERVRGDGVRPHRVTGEHVRPRAGLGREHRVEVGGELGEPVSRPSGRRVGLAVAARVVGERAKSRAGQRAGAVDDVAPRRREAVQEGDRVPLPRALALQRKPVPLDGERGRLAAHRTSAASRARARATARCSTSL